MYFLALAGICMKFLILGIVIVIVWYFIKKRNTPARSKTSNKMPSFSSSSGGLKL
jgi:hypothetical protein